MPESGGGRGGKWQRREQMPGRLSTTGGAGARAQRRHWGAGVSGGAGGTDERRKGAGVRPVGSPPPTCSLIICPYCYLSHCSGGVTNLG